MTTDFCLLGGIEAWIDGRAVDLGHARQRLVLAVLLVEVNRAVPIDRLEERVWGVGLAQRGRGTLYSYLSRLRQALGAVGGGVDLVRGTEGYVLSADADAVDVHRFRRLVAEARGAQRDEVAGRLFGEALGLWRGEPFGEVDVPWVNGVREGLRQERLAAELDRNGVGLRLGQHRELLAGLGVRARECPLDERLSGQLMLALYRCGRASEALAWFREVQGRLAEGLGVDPGPELQRLHQRILSADPSLAPERPDRVPGAGGAGATAGSAGAGGTGGAGGFTGGGVPLPRQLPAAPGLFAGRADELALLSEVLAGGAGNGDEEGTGGGGPVVAVVSGSGGAGKTWLVLRWAHDHVDRFPDGQLYVNLRGFDPGRRVLAPETALRGFLGALGVGPGAVPAGFEAQVGLYRSLVAGRRLLVVLDNAADAGQVVPLLPGGGECAVVVTSRRRLTGLAASHAARQVTVGVLGKGESRVVLARHLGQGGGPADDPAAVDAVVRHCGGLPLALSVVAARAVADPGFPLGLLAEELGDEATRLDALDAGDPAGSLRTVFATSFRMLEGEQAQAFAYLGLVPGGEIGLTAAASLLGARVAVVRGWLRGLQSAHLVEQPVPGRYRFHDLVRLYAAERASELPGGEREEALRRLADHCLHTAAAGNRLADREPRSGTGAGTSAETAPETGTETGPGTETEGAGPGSGTGAQDRA